MNGKSKCKLLKEIRRQIAAQNDIEFVTAECKFQGECSGTCPKCESEVRYLEQELQKRRMAGKAVAVAGIAATLVVTASGCIPAPTGGSPLPATSTSQQEIVGGEVLPPETTEAPILKGVPELPTEPPMEMGDIVEPTEPPETTKPIDSRLPPYNNDDTMGYIG